MLIMNTNYGEERDVGGLEKLNMHQPSLNRSKIGHPFGEKDDGEEQEVWTIGRGASYIQEWKSNEAATHDHVGSKLRASKQRYW